MTEIFNPLKQPNAATSESFIATASSDIANYTETPKSPISGEPMILSTCGPSMGPNFKAWVHLRDRIVLPYRG